MKVLVVGTGAREHAIADALKDDVELYCYMSKVNPGMSKIAEFKQGDEGEVEKVAEYAVENDISILAINIGTVGFLSSFEEKDLSGEKLTEVVSGLITDKEKLDTMSKNAKECAIVDTNERIYKVITDLYASIK